MAVLPPIACPGHCQVSTHISKVKTLGEPDITLRPEAIEMLQTDEALP